MHDSLFFNLGTKKKRIGLGGSLTPCQASLEEAEKRAAQTSRQTPIELACEPLIPAQVD